jgi:hypothetical protein
MNKFIKTLALVLAVLPASLMATPITPTTIVGVTGYADYNSVNAFAMGQSFTTDANAWKLSGVTLSLANPSATSQGSFAVGLYADDAGSIGSLIGSLTTAQTSFFTTPFGGIYSFQNILFTNNSLTLAANTTYWVGVSNPNTDFYGEVLYGINKTGVGTYGAGFLENSALSSSTPLNVTVTGTSVPEPSTYALMGLGALALVIAVRRRTA